MGRNRTIALVAGTIVTVVTLVLCMGALIFGGYFPDDRILVFASLALAPLAMLSVMVGYAVWWLILFLLTLFFPEEETERQT
jgi:hypothetical protein